MFIHTNQLLITSLYIKKVPIFTELAMSQRWSAIFCETGGWGAKPIGRARVNEFLSQTHSSTAKFWFNRINWFGLQVDQSRRDRKRKLILFPYQSIIISNSRARSEILWFQHHLGFKRTNFEKMKFLITYETFVKCKSSKTIKYFKFLELVLLKPRWR